MCKELLQNQKELFSTMFPEQCVYAKPSHDHSPDKVVYHSEHFFHKIYRVPEASYHDASLSTAQHLFPQKLTFNQAQML